MDKDVQTIDIFRCSFQSGPIFGGYRWSLQCDLKRRLLNRDNRLQFMCGITHEGALTLELGAQSGDKGLKGKSKRAKFVDLSHLRREVKSPPSFSNRGGLICEFVERKHPFGDGKPGDE